jgi:hypothetical protein
MRTHVGARAVRVLASLLMAAVVAGVSGAAVAADRAGPAVPAASLSFRGGLIDVAAASARSAWAVGRAGSICSPRTLILRWNGTAWKRVPSPRLAGSALDGVATSAARSAWAVGYADGGLVQRTLILRWNGNAWKRVPSPAPDGGILIGVTAISARSAWAVGGTAGGSTDGYPNRQVSTLRHPRGRELRPQRVGRRVYRQRRQA